MRGPLAVAVPDGVEHFLVLGDVLGDAVGLGVHDGHPHAQLAVPHLVVEPGQDLVPGVAHDLGVEAAVADGDGGQVPGGGVRLLLGQEFLEAYDEALRCGYGSAHRELLDEQPGFDHVGGLLRGDGEHQGTLLRVELEQPFDFELEQGFAHRRPRNPDRLGQFALGEQRAALVAAVEYRLLDVHVDAVGGGGCLVAGAWAGDMRTG